jgi:hypothetical protein
MGDLVALENYRKREIVSFDVSEMTSAFFHATGILLTIGAISEGGMFDDKIIGWFGVATVGKKEAGANYATHRRAAKVFNATANGQIYAEAKDVLTAMLDAMVGERLSQGGAA